MVDTDMQGEIRASGINPVSKIARETLLPVGVPAAAIALLIRAVPAAWRGRDLDVREEEFQRAAGLDGMLSRWRAAAAAICDETVDQAAPGAVHNHLGRTW